MTLAHWPLADWPLADWPPAWLIGVILIWGCQAEPPPVSSRIPRPITKLPSVTPPATPLRATPPQAATPTPHPLRSVWQDPSLPQIADDARQHVRAGRLGMARIAFEGAWAADPRPEFALWAGVIWQRAGEHAQALRWLARADVPELEVFVAWREVRSAAALPDVDRALEAARRIPSTARFHARAVRRVAQALLTANQPAHAIAWLDHHAVDRPDFALRARAYTQAGQPFEAARAWQRALLDTPSKAVQRMATNAIARLRRRLSAKGRAALRLPLPDGDHIAGRADLAAHRYPQLEARMLAALSAGADDCLTWWLLARARARQRDHGHAAPAYARAAILCDASRAPRARFAEARAWFNADDHAAAIHALEQLDHDWPTHRLADDALLLTARVHFAGGTPALGIEMLRRVLWHHPSGDIASDAAWLLWQHTGEATPALPPAPDRSLVARLAYFRDRDASGPDRFAEIFARSPSGYYAAWAIAHGARPAPAAPPPIHLPHTHPTRIAGWRLLDLGLVRDAWWAFDAAGPGALEPGRYSADVARAFAQHGHTDLAQRMFARDVPHLDGLPFSDETAAWFAAVYPLPHLDRFTHWATVHAVPLPLLLAIAHTESRFDSTARSWAGACGMLQLVPSTAQAVARRAGIRGRITCRRLRNPDLSIRLAARYLAELRARFGDHPVALAAAYNAGPGNVARWLTATRPAPDRWVEEIPFHQARRYVKRVIAALRVYEIRLQTPVPLLRPGW